MHITEKEILEITHKIYPTCVGVILTGSQINANNINLKNDIDLVVLDSRISVVSSNYLILNNIKFDFTQIPLNDIENVLFNLAFDAKGKVFSMIKKGKIIKDAKNSIFKLIKTKIEIQFNQVSPNNIISYNGYITLLSKLRKDFDREMDIQTKFFLTNEFIITISNAELIKCSNWNNAGKHKAQFLQANNPKFVNSLISLTESFLKNEKNDTSNIVAFIDQYLSTPFHFNLSKVKFDSIILELSYEDFNIDDFINKILPLIRNDQTLSKIYSYYFASPSQYKYIYNYQVCIAFKSDDVNEFDCFERVYNVLKKELANPIISIFPTYGYAISRNKSFNLAFTEISITVNRMLEKLVFKDKAFEIEQCILLLIVISASLLKQLNMGLEDIIKVNFYICNRWLFNNTDQTKIKAPNDFFNFSKAKLQLFISYYKTNKAFIDEAAKTGFWGEGLEEKIYFKTIEKIKELILSVPTSMQDIYSKNELTVEILRNQYYLKNPENGLLYVLILEKLTSLLLLNNNQAALGTFLISESVKATYEVPNFIA